MVSVSQLIILVCVFNFSESWRRRRRVSTAGDSESKRKRVMTKMKRQESCLLHGEYTRVKGKILPANTFQMAIQNVKCNNERCWKGDYCWECRLKNGKRWYEPLTRQKIKDLVCEDAQCLLGKVDAGFHYYSTNETRSLPLSPGPFHCNKYICMTLKRCWKCRLNSDDIDFETIEKGSEFNEKVTCCPLPKVLISVNKTINIAASKMQEKIGSDDIMLLSDAIEDDSLSELDEPDKNQILINFKTKKLVTGIHIRGTNNAKGTKYTVSHSLDGHNWVDYKEYNLKAIFYSKSKIGSRTLFKPIITRFLKLKPLDNVRGIQITVDVVGCELLSSQKKKSSP